MAIAAQPCTIVEVAPERGEASLDTDIGEHGNRTSDARVKICLRSAPIGLQESIRAIMRNRDGSDLHLLERLPVSFNGRTDGPAKLYDFRKVIPHQPHSGILIVPGKNDAAPRDTRHFAQSLRLIRPMM